MLVFSLAGAPLSISQDATRAVNLLYCRSPGGNSISVLFLFQPEEGSEDNLALILNGQLSG